MDDLDAKGASRRRVVEWADPRASAEPAIHMDGLAYIEAVIAGKIPPPPMAVLLGISVVSVGPGRSELEMRSAEFLYNPIGTVHGGAIATLLDSAMGCAVHSTLGAGRGCTTLEIKVNYVSGVGIASGTLRATAETLHAGGHHAVVEGRVYDQSGKLCATSMSTYSVMGPRT